MAAGSALKKINARVKQLAKRYPKKKRVSLQKQAGKEYRAGKLRAKRPAKRKSVKRKPVKRKSAPVRKTARKRAVRRSAPRKRAKRSASAVLLVERGGTKRTRPTRVYKVKRSRKGTYAGVKRIAGRRRSVGSKIFGIKPGTLAMLAGGGLLLYLATRPATPSALYVPTGNVQRDTKAQQIINAATAAGVAAAQIAQIMKQFNSKSDAQIDAKLQQIQAYGPAAANDWA